MIKKRRIRFLMVLAFGGVLLSVAVNERIPIAQNDKNKIESGTKTEFTPETENIAKTQPYNEDYVDGSIVEFTGKNPNDSGKMSQYIVAYLIIYPRE